MTALVMIMTPGVAFFSGGLVGEKNIVATMMLSFGSMSVVSICWALIGYSIAFGPVHVPGPSMNTPVDYTFKDNGADWKESTAAPKATKGTQFMGNTQLSLLSFGDGLRQSGWGGIEAKSYYWDTEGANPIYFNVTEHTYMLFQLMFAIVTVALISGAVVGKIKYVWFMVFAAVWHLVIYCPLAHWIFFYDGWLFYRGALDFAGGTVVHESSGISGLVLSFWLSYGRTSKAIQKPHAVPFVLLGAALLWFGWFGFNAGSALSASSDVTARAFANTHLGASAGMIMFGIMEMVFGSEEGLTGFSNLFKGRPTAIGAATGAIIGLVGVTPACGFVSQMFSILIAVLTVIPCYFAPKMLRACGFTESLDCFGVHGVGGIIGAILTGVFASKKTGDSIANGAIEGNGFQVALQLEACAVTAAYSIVGTTVIFWALQLLAWSMGSDLRLDELAADDLDASEHGEKGYGSEGKSPLEVSA